MLHRCIGAENIKLRHSFIFPACIVIPVIPAIMGTFNYLQNTEILTEGWYSLWTQLTLFYACFFYAPLIALYCSYLWRLEHRGSNWNVLMSSPVPVPCVFFAKLAIVCKVTVLTQLWMGILFLICGKLTRLPGLPPAEIILWLLRGTLAAVAIGALQLFLSMVIRSFSVPIAIALIGSVSGMLLSNKGFGLCWPYSLMLMGMNSNKAADGLSGSLLPYFAATFLFFAVFSAVSIQLLKRRDVHA